MILKKLTNKNIIGKELLKEILIFNDDIFIAFKSKNPEIKKNLLKICDFYDENIVKIVIKLLDDSNPSVRNASTEYLAKQIYNGHDEIETMIENIDKIKKKKIYDHCNNLKNNLKKSEINDLKNTEEDDIKKFEKNDIKKINIEKQELKIPDKKRIVFKDIPIQSNIQNQILNYFQSKYDFLLQREWNLRMEGLIENIENLKNENITDFLIFIISNNEPVFQISKKYIEILNTIPENKLKNDPQIQLYILKYIQNKFNEIKLRSEIITLLKKLYKINKMQIISFMVYYAKTKKQGKLFIDMINTIIEIIGLIN